ncbi:MAG: hypothetical protein ORN28_05210, partial [Rhodoferax sp.]|nr:hypothetical protein [Rhodoferax sp.]
SRFRGVPDRGCAALAAAGIPPVIAGLTRNLATSLLALGNHKGCPYNLNPHSFKGDTSGPAEPVPQCP